MISSAQALLLGCIETHAIRDEPVYVYGSPERSKVSLIALAEEHGRLYGVDSFVAVDETLPALVHASLPFVRWATVKACARHGWVTDGGVDEFETQRIGNQWFLSAKTLRIRRVVGTDAGEQALHAFRLKPPAPQPDLGGVERELVALAAKAETFGYALVPVTDEAKRGARALARTPFAKRGWGGGASTRSLKATATGEVEVS